MSDSNGAVKAFASFTFVDLNGITRVRRVRVAQEYCVSRDMAKAMAKRIREANPELGMRVQYAEEM